jgi:hypothetical protein
LILVTSLALVAVRMGRRQQSHKLALAQTASAIPAPTQALLPEAQETAPPASVPALIPPTANPAGEFYLAFAPTAKPDRMVSVQRKISSALRIDAQAVEPASLVKKVQPVAPVKFDARDVLAKVFAQPEAKRTSEDMGQGRTDYRNSAGEVALIEPGRIYYERHESSGTEYRDLFGRIDQGSLKGGWYLPDRKSLDKELPFRSREDVIAFALSYFQALLPEGSPYTPKVETLRALSFADIQQLFKACREDGTISFSDLPGSGPGEVLRDGVYSIQMRFYEGEIPIYREPMDTDPGSTTYAVYHTSSGPSMEMVISSQGVLLVEASGIWQRWGPAREVNCLPVEQAVAALEKYGGDMLRYEARYSIDEIYLMQVPLLRGRDTDTIEYFLWPMWCFEDGDFQGEWEHQTSVKLYLDATTGLPIPEMR